MAKVNTSGSGTSIFGQVAGGNAPSGEGAGVLKDAMDCLDDSFSNKINGTVKDSRTSEYDPENGK